MPCEEEDGEEEGGEDGEDGVEISSLVITCDRTDLIMSLYGKDDRLEDVLRSDLIEAASSEDASLSSSSTLLRSRLSLCLETAVWLKGRSSSFPSPPRGVGEVVLPSAADGRGPCKTVASVAILMWVMGAQQNSGTTHDGKKLKKKDLRQSSQGE